VLLANPGRGQLEDKRATAVVDLVMATTWTVDVVELKDLDRAEVGKMKATVYTQLMTGHLVCERAMLKDEA
jgi:hypothetical protein